MMGKNKTAFWPSLVPKGTLSSILTVKRANDMSAYQFEPTRSAKSKQICNMEIQ